MSEKTSEENFGEEKQYPEKTSNESLPEDSRETPESLIEEKAENYFQQYLDLIKEGKSTDEAENKIYEKYLEQE